MTKFLVLWRRNMLAPWSADRREVEENIVAMFEALDRYVDAEMVTENAFFADADSGCFVFQGTSEDVFNMTSMFGPFIKYEVREMIPYELGKNTILENLRAKTLAR
ncbi:MAG: hypothetical protein ACXV5N_10975 [Halobacteriota archaeon]